MNKLYQPTRPEGFKMNRDLHCPMPRVLKQDQDAECYAYPHHEIELVDGLFHQTRSGPNWQGGLMTLATCKHYLRQTRPIGLWVGVWFAGFAPRTATPGDNYLLYLARVGGSFCSNYQLGRALPSGTYRAKLATHNPLGDIFEPKKRLLTEVDQYSYRNFVEPVGHVRQTEFYKDGSPKWHRDIQYFRNRHPAALLMDEVFLFNRPVYKTNRELHRSGFKCTIGELVRNYLEK
jgi:hypothetical protein